MTYRPLLLLSLILLAGCASAEQLAQRDQDRCVARGYKPETKEFNDCMTLVENERVARRDALHREQIEKSANPFRYP
jgi:uncharacterized protein YcfL